MLYIVSLAFLIVSASGVFYYITSSQNMQAEIQKSNESILKTTSSSYEVFLDHIVRGMLHLGGGMMDSATGGADYATGVFSQINSLSKLSEYIVGVYYFEQNPQTIYLSEGISFDFVDFYDVNWVSSLDTAGGYSVLPARRMPTLTGELREVVPIVISYPLSAAQPVGTYVVNLDAAGFFRMASAGIIDSGEYRFRIVEKNGLVFIASDGAYNFTSLQDVPHLAGYEAQILSGEGGQFETESDTKLLVGYLPSTRYDWVYILELDYSTVQANLRAPLYTFLVFSLVLFAASLALGLLFSRRLYRPIGELVKVFSLNRERNEFDAVKEHVEHFVDENKVLRSTLEVNKAHLEKQFLYNLLTRNIYAPAEVDGYFSEMGFETAGRYVVALFELAEYESLLGRFSMKDWALWEFAFENIAVEIAGRDATPLYTSIESNRFALVLRLPPDCEAGEAERQAQKAAEDIIDAITHHLDFHFIAGVSNTGPDIYDIHKNYIQAVTALRMNNRTSGALPYRLLGTQPDALAVTPRDEELLGKMVLMGDEDEALRAFRDVYARYRAAAQPGALNLHFFSFQILALVMKYIIEFGLDERQVLYQGNSYANLCVLLASPLDEAERLSILAGCLAALCAQISAKRNDITDSQLLQVVGYIQQNYAGPISLDSISDATKLKKNYISRLIRQHFNVSVVDYINSIRVEKAIELIRETDMKVYAVAEAVGFNNPHYFIKIFRKFTGKTPGQMIEEKQTGKGGHDA